MEDKAKRAAGSASGNLFSAVIFMTFLAFLGGTMLGKTAHQFYVTMFSPDVIVVPQENR